MTTDNEAKTKSHEHHFDLNKQNGTAVFKALQEAAISQVIVNFDGEGDSGQIEDIVAYSNEKVTALPKVNVDRHFGFNAETLESKPVPLIDAIESLCYDYLSDEHGGWENNDGGYGDFTFHVADSRIELEIGLRYTDSTQYSHTF